MKAHRHHVVVRAIKVCVFFGQIKSVTAYVSDDVNLCFHTNRPSFFSIFINADDDVDHAFIAISFNKRVIS